MIQRDTLLASLLAAAVLLGVTFAVVHGTAISVQAVHGANQSAAPALEFGGPGCASQTGACSVSGHSDCGAGCVGSNGCREYPGQSCGSGKELCACAPDWRASISGTLTIIKGQSTTLTATASGSSGGNSYAWTYGTTSCSTSLGSSSSVVVAPATNTLYCVDITDSYGDASTASVQVTVLPSHPVAAAPTPNPAPLDAGQTATLRSSVTFGTQPYSYEWYYSTTSISTCASGLAAAPGANLQPTYTFNPSTFSSFPVWICYQVTDSESTPWTSNSPADKVTLNGAIGAGGATPLSQSIDAGQAATLTATPSGGSQPYTYQWYEDAYGSTPPTTCAVTGAPWAQVSGATSQVLSATPPSNTAYCYTLGDSSVGTPVAAATSIVPSLVTVNPALTAAPITPSTPVITYGGSGVTLSSHASGGTPPYTYEWYAEIPGVSGCGPPYGSTGYPGAIYAVNPPGNTFYCYAVTDSATIPVTVVSPPDEVVVNVPATVAYNACGFAGSASNVGYINAHNWVGINTAIILLTIMIAAFIYSISGLMPSTLREKFRGASRYEVIQAVVSILIVVILVLFATSMCFVGESIASSVTNGHAFITNPADYTGPFTYAETYVQVLLFSSGLGLVTNLYATAVEYSIEAEVYEGILGAFSQILQFIKGLTQTVNPTSFLQFSVTTGYTLAMVFLAYTELFTGVYATAVVITFGGLFLLWLILFITYSIALTILVPVSIVMRSFGFVGPRLREASDQLLGLAIAFYFILPLMLSFNNYVVGWIYTYSNPAYVGTYSIGSLPSSSVFSGGPPNTGLGNLPGELGGLISGGDGGAFGIGVLWTAPTDAYVLGNETAQYLFQGVVLVALDFAVTLGCAIGLSKALGAINGLVSSGPIWGKT